MTEMQKSNKLDQIFLKLCNKHLQFKSAYLATTEIKLTFK